MELTRKTMIGFGWTGGARIAKVFSQLLVTIILANVISPAAFGVLSMATVFTGVLTLFSDFGLGAALVQVETIDELLIDSCLLTNLVIGLILALLTIVLAPFAGQFYSNDQVINVLFVLAVNFPILSLGTVQAALLERSLSFKLVSVSEIVASLIAAIVAVACALVGADIWSLVIWQLLQSAIRTFILWLYSPFRMRLRFEYSRMAALISFSLHSLGFNLVNYGARNADYLLIGRFLDANSLGLYTMAYNIMMLPVSNLTSIISRVLFPAFSRKQNDLASFRQGYLRAITFIALISFPLMTGMYVTASDIVHLFLGNKWLPIIPLIKLFVWVGMIQSLLSLNGSVYVALGKVRLRFWLGLIFSSVSVLGIVWGLSYGTILSTATGYAIASIVLVLPGTIVPLRLLNIGMLNFVGKLAPIFISSLVMGLALIWSGFGFQDLIGNQYILFVLKVFVGASIYLLVLFFINRSVMSDLLNLVLRMRRPANVTL